ncbi:hypothetical protein JMJ56_15360 [Belnapia sp. T18]|uniref:LytR/CpsA/Psr regulator C-terminal domain-containing protein n=1 Tax=Belnapia arida TaxID=2804533 RepID=A0ABS1U400_9PROT|nr:hypothetical protein [Belnapia arida]MBL6079396.1 hypothetical protein [Belnapia arida]
MAPAGLVLALAGLAGGVTLGLGLRAPPHPAAPVASLAPAPQPVPAPAAPAPAPASAADAAALRAGVAAEQARLDSLRQARASAEAELATLRQSRASAEAELATLRQARTAAEAELATLRRDLAAGRRELAANQPPTPQPLAPPPRPLRLPETAAAAPGQPRVYIHLRAGSVAAASAASELAPQLREAGFDLGEPRVVTATPSQRVVRYFHGEDAPAAARLAGRLGRGWAIQDFRNFEPAPSTGTLEIWLPDR